MEDEDEEHAIDHGIIWSGNLRKVGSVTEQRLPSSLHQMAHPWYANVQPTRGYNIMGHS